MTTSTYLGFCRVLINCCLFLSIASCDGESSNNDKCREWIAGKVHSQIQEIEIRSSNLKLDIRQPALLDELRAIVLQGKPGDMPPDGRFYEMTIHFQEDKAIEVSVLIRRNSITLLIPEDPSRPSITWAGTLGAANSRDLNDLFARLSATNR